MSDGVVQFNYKKRKKKKKGFFHLRLEAAVKRQET